MSVFGDDVPSQPITPPETFIQPERAAALAAGIHHYLWERYSTHVGLHVPAVRIAESTLGLIPLKDSVYAIVAAMEAPPQALEEKYRAADDAFAGFAAAVNTARAAVHFYAEECWHVRRELLTDWSRRADSVEPNSEQWDAAIAELTTIVAEADTSERRLAVFEYGIRAAIKSTQVDATWLAEDGTHRYDHARIDRLTRAVEAAGVRHSGPPANTCAVDRE